MRALLLCAGLGSRLRPLTDTVPKCLVPILGKPLLDYWLEILDQGGVQEALVNLHYKADLVRKHLETVSYGVRVSTVFEPTLLQTGGTLLKNREFFGGDSILLVHADNLSDFDLREFARAHAARERGVEITMMTFETDSPQTCGIVEIDERQIVRAFHEKVKNPPGNLANAAVYILEPAVFDFLGSLNKEVIDFSTEVLPHYLGRIQTWHNSGYHRDIGTPESLKLAEKEFADRRKNASR